MYKIRDAVDTDAAIIMKIWSDGYKYAHGDILSADGIERTVGVDKVREKIAQFPEKLRYERAIGNVFLVVTYMDKVVGYVCGGVPESKECAADKELYKLYIDVSHIGRGVGKLLLQSFARAMKNQGARTFGLMCFSENKSMGFYKNMGGIITIERHSGEKYENKLGSFLEFNIDVVLGK